MRKLKVFVTRHVVTTADGNVVTFVIRSTHRNGQPYWQFAKRFATLRAAGKQAALFAAPNGASLYRPEEWIKVEA